MTPTQSPGGAGGETCPDRTRHPAPDAHADSLGAAVARERVNNGPPFGGNGRATGRRSSRRPRHAAGRGRRAHGRVLLLTLSVDRLLLFLNRLPTLKRGNIPHSWLPMEKHGTGNPELVLLPAVTGLRRSAAHGSAGDTRVSACPTASGSLTFWSPCVALGAGELPESG